MSEKSFFLVVLLLSAVVAAGLVVALYYAMIYNLLHPELTSAQVFLLHWPMIIGGTAAALAASAAVGQVLRGEHKNAAAGGDDGQTKKL